MTMLHSKQLSLSQDDLADGVDSTDYKVASNSCSLHELNSTGNKLPLVIRIEDGFYGKTDWTTISSDEILFLYGLKLRKRVLATAEDGTRYSFPLDYPLLFTPLPPEPPYSTKTIKSRKQKPEIYNEVSSHPISLKEIIENHKLPISVDIDDAYVIFHSTNHERETVHFGTLTLTHVYDEKYYVGNEIRNGNLSHEVTLLPTFLRIKVRLVQGFAQKKKKHSWKAVVTEWTTTASQVNYDAVKPPSDVAAFQPDAVAKVVKSPGKLDAIEPNTYIKLTFLPLDTIDHTYEELPLPLQSHSSSEPSVSTFKLPTTPASRHAIQFPDLSTNDFDPYNQVDSPTSSDTATPFADINSISESSYQQQSLSLPGKRLQPRSYSPVPSPPIALSTVKVPPSLLQKAITTRAPMPLPKKSSNTEPQPTSDLPFVIPVQRDGFPDASRLDSYGRNESPKAITPDQRRQHPVVPLPPVLKPSDLQKALKPTNKSVDLGTSSTSLDLERHKSETRTPPRKPHKPRSKTDLALTTSAARLLHQEANRQDIKAVELGREDTEHRPPLPKYKTPSPISSKTQLSKTRASSPQNDRDNADPNTSLPDYDELLSPEPNIKTPKKIKLPPLLPSTDSKSSGLNNEAFCLASPKIPPPPPKFFPTEYEFPSSDSNSNLSDSELPDPPEIPQLNYEKLPTKDHDTIERIADIPEQLENLSCFHLADCLKLLNMESYIPTFLANQIDGKLLLELDEEILTSDLNVSKLHAKKLLMFAHRGWRP